jgi:signal transduction histidine kinase
MIEDITDRKQIEQELSEMRRRLMHSRENERLRLAQELHDNPLQDIIGLSFQVQGLQNDLKDQ